MNKFLKIRKIFVYPLLIITIVLFSISFLELYPRDDNVLSPLEKLRLKFSKSSKISQLAKDSGLLEDYLRKNGIKITLNNLLAETGSGFEYDCHLEAHEIGRAAYRVFREKAFAEGNEVCHSGVYHGAMEAFLMENGNLTPKDVENLCSKFETYFGVFQCFHGAGHGFLLFTNYELPKALSDCKSFDRLWKQTSCFDGVFMENIVIGRNFRLGNGLHKTNWLSDDPYFPCLEYGSDSYIQSHCFRMQTSWMLTLSGYDYQGVIDKCRKIQADMVSWCFKGLGRDIAGNGLRNSDEILSKCVLVPKDIGYAECINGAVSVIVDFWGADLEDQATSLCNLVSDSFVRKDCYFNLVDLVIQVFGEREKQLSFCSGFDESYKKSCVDHIEQTSPEQAILQRS